MTAKRRIGRIGGLVALLAGAAAAGTVALDWIVTSSETIAFTGQTLDAIPVGYQTWSGLLVAAGASLTFVGGLLWLARGRGSFGPLLVALGSGATIGGAVWVLRWTVDEFIRYAVTETGISKDTMTDLTSSFVDDGSVTIEASDWVLVAIAAGVVGLILGLTGLVIASARSAEANASDQAPPLVRASETESTQGEW
jgi:hypothetical protein